MERTNGAGKSQYHSSPSIHLLLKRVIWGNSADEDKQECLLSSFYLGPYILDLPYLHLFRMIVGALHGLLDRSFLLFNAWRFASHPTDTSVSAHIRVEGTWGSQCLLPPECHSILAPPSNQPPGALSPPCALKLPLEATGLLAPSARVMK